MASTIYRGSPSRFAFAQTHYTSSSSSVNGSVNGDLQGPMGIRYSAFAVEGHNVPLPSVPPPLPTTGLMNGLTAPMPPGASLGLTSSKQLYGGGIKSPMYMQGVSSSQLYANPLHPKVYAPPPSDLLLVSPGLPTPVELSIYEMKQPTGLLHVTIGNQTVEFLDGVANMPQKR